MMLQFIRAFGQKSVRFIDDHRWIFVLFTLASAAIWVTQRRSFFEVFSVFGLHFVADIWIMMMLDEYTRGNRRGGTLLQIASTVLFLALKIHSGLAHGSWQYLSADVLYLLSAYKNYQFDLRGRHVTWINSLSGTAIAAAILLGIYLPRGLLSSVSQWTQTAGIFIFAIALINCENKNRRYTLSLLGLSAMVVGSGMECWRTIQLGEIGGLALSYFLLPSAVLAFFLKQWNNYLPTVNASAESRDTQDISIRHPSRLRV